MSITFEVDPEVGIKMQQTRLHLDNDSPLTENFTATIDSISGTQYDNNFMAHSMQDVSDIDCDYEEMRVFKGDKILFTWPNSDGRTWGFEFIWDNFC